MMKKILIVGLFSALVSCNDAGTETNSNASTVAAPADVTYAYPIAYSSKFEMGDPKKAQQVAQLWKDFDDNKLSNQKNLFADSVEMNFPGAQMNGTRDSMFAETQRYRDQLTSVRSTIDAIMTTKSIDKDKDGNWVCVWGSEVVTKEGKVDSARLHELWHFNKDGKIDYMSQFRQPYPTAKK
jgi:hypothetical protein